MYVASLILFLQDVAIIVFPCSILFVELQLKIIGTFWIFTEIVDPRNLQLQHVDEGLLCKGCAGSKGQPDTDEDILLLSMTFYV